MEDQIDVTTEPEKTSRKRPNNRGQIGNRGNTRAVGGPVSHGYFLWLATGQLPADAGYIDGILAKFRNALEQEVIARRGEMTVGDGLLINSAYRHEGRALLLGHYLKQESDVVLGATETETRSMSRPNAEGKGTYRVTTSTTRQPVTVEVKMGLLRDISGATTARDLCLKQLGIFEPPRREGEGDDFWTVPAVPSPPEGEPGDSTGDAE